MRRRVLMLVAGLSSAVLLGACGGGEVVVQAQLDGDTIAGGDADGVALSDLEIQILPYDRDVIFDSLEAAYPDPEPEIPDSVLALQDSIAEANQVWRQLENQWAVLRDSLSRMSEAMNAMDRSSGEYTVMFRDYNALEPVYNRVDSQREAAFQRFSDIQDRFATQTQMLRLERDQWANTAFSSVDEVIEARLDELGREELFDTTSAAGTVTRSVPPGEWWVHARYELPYSELYWNIPITVERGERVEVRLTRENAQIRVKI